MDCANDMMDHIIDLKAEVVRLRAQKVELTEEERMDVEYIRCEPNSAVHDGSRKIALLRIIDRLCPPKAPPTDAELLDMLRDATRSNGPDALAKVEVVIDALRARSK